MELTFKPRLTRGSHLTTSDETGDFCLVEAVGFNIDRRPLDHHPLINPVLASMARTLNDRMCAGADNRGDRTSPICDHCQDELWKIGARIADTGRPGVDQRAVNASMALAGALAVRHMLKSPNDPMFTLVSAAIRAARGLLANPSDAQRSAVNTCVSDLSDETAHRSSGIHTWVGMAASQAAAAALHSLDSGTGGYFAERRAIEAVSYAVTATAGNVPASMRVARKVLVSFENFHSQADTKGSK